MKRPVLAGKLVTLEELLRPSQPPQLQPLTDEDRYILAITLASSFLQLYKTPWLSDHWCKKDIAFFLESSNRQRQVVDVRHPFVVQTYHQPQGAILSPRTDTFNTPSSAHDSTNLLNLAKIHLEVRFNNCFEDIQRTDRLDPNVP